MTPTTITAISERLEQLRPMRAELLEDAEMLAQQDQELADQFRERVISKMDQEIDLLLLRLEILERRQMFREISRPFTAEEQAEADARDAKIEAECEGEWA